MSGMDEFSDGMKKALQAIFDSGFKAGREAGMREAAELCEDGIRDGPLSPAERYRAGFIRDAILSAIEGAK